MKKLRYTFNSAFREQRLANQLEDETDDEEDVLLGRVAPAAGAASAEMDDEEDSGPDIQESGVTKGPGKPLPKRELTSKYSDNLRDGSVGLFSSDPLFSKSKSAKRKAAHRSSKNKGGSNKPGSAAAHFWKQGST